MCLFVRAGLGVDIIYQRLGGVGAVFGPLPFLALVLRCPARTVSSLSCTRSQKRPLVESSCDEVQSLLCPWHLLARAATCVEAQVRFDS